MGLTSFLYKKINTISVTSKFLEKKYRNIWPHVELVKKNDFTAVNLVGKSQTRGQATAKILIDCLKELATDKDLHFKFFINDKPAAGYEDDSFYYCIDDDQKQDFLIPDFAFESWKEAGINSFSNTVAEIEAKGKETWGDPRVFWVGNVKTNIIREKLIEIGNQSPEIFDFYNTYVDDYFIHKKDVQYFTLPEHTRYKYLIDVEGNSYSARLKFLFYSQRVVFLQERKWKEYFHYDLKPYEHYIPVKNDLSDLVDQYNRIEKDPMLYKQITENALKFAHENLTYQCAVDKMRSTIENRINKP